MLHTLDMPSFLGDDSGSNIAAQHLSSEPEELQYPHDRTNGSSRPYCRKPTKGSFEIGPENYRDSHYRGVVNGDMQHDINGLSSLSKGSIAGSWENKSFRNNSALSVNGSINGIVENGRRSPAPQNGMPKTSTDRSSVASMNGGALQAGSGNESSSKQISNGDGSGPPKRIPPPPPNSSNPHSTGPLTYTSSLMPASPIPETPSRSGIASPHRFSSPPAYPSSLTSATSPSASGSLQQPAAPQLKHRHTLQVPKPGPGRGSKDGEDAAYTSGRFSPTTAAGTAGRRGSLSLYRRNTRSIHSDMPHEEVPQDEDAMRWAEAIRQRRASKRKRKDDEDDDRVVVGTKVDQNHVNWVTAYNMLTGIRFTVSRTNAKMDRPLTDQDFEARHKFSFDM